MSGDTTGKVHWSFLAIGAMALIWNALGSINFIVQALNADIVAHYRANERALIEGRPLWATMGFALAVFGGAAGSVLLLLRKRTAFFLFLVSLAGVVATMAHTLAANLDFSAGEIAGIVIMPVLVAAFLVWYARFAERKGWVGRK